MSTIVARTGRHLQRYENNLRLVSGCIPYRLKNEVNGHFTNLERRVQVLMISSPNRDDLVFPKGGWENDETVEEAALREAIEEAGIRGVLKEKLGVWEFRSKSSQEIGSQKKGCRGYMFAMEVTEELDAWPEQGNRKREWLFVEEAFSRCRYEWMCGALEEFVKVMSRDWKHEMIKEAIALRPFPVSIDQKCQIMSTSCSSKLSSSENHELLPLNWSLGLCLQKYFGLWLKTYINSGGRYQLVLFILFTVVVGLL